MVVHTFILFIFYMYLSTYIALCPCSAKRGPEEGIGNPLELELQKVLNPLNQCWELCPGPGRAMLLTSGPSLRLWFETGLAMEP